MAYEHSLHARKVPAWPTVSNDGARPLSDRTRSTAPSRPAVLIMDDNADFAEFVGQVVGSCGGKPTIVTDSSSFKLVCAAVRPCTVVLDIQMPGIDGLQLTQWLGEFSVIAGLDTRLIIISGRDGDTLDLCKSVAAMAGICEVQAFHKPIEVATLCKALRQPESRWPGGAPASLPAPAVLRS